MTDDRQILDDYVLWSTTKELDTTIDAFLAERKAGADAARVNEALEVLAIAQHNAEQVKDYGNDFAVLLNAVAAATFILIDDRPTIDDSTLTERRTYLT